MRRQRVIARKAGQNMGAGFIQHPQHQNLAAVYAPMMYYDNQNLLQHQQYLASSSQGGFVHLGAGAGALIGLPNQQLVAMNNRLNHARASHQPNHSILFDQY